MFKGRGKIQARLSTQKMGPVNNVNKTILSFMYTKGKMVAYSGSESSQAT